ncbi:MAG: lipopolysaccharide heptosyltransferase I [Betaproteobacteria bacterium]
MRLLLVKTSSMGDVVHALPVASDIAARLPGAELDWVVEEAFADVPRLHPAVRRVVPVALRRWRHAPLAAASWRELRAARAALRGGEYDLVLDAQGLLKSAWIARWARAPVAGLDAASAREPLASRFYAHRYAVPRELHAIERMRALAGQALGYTPRGVARFALRLPPLEASVAAALPAAPYAVLLTHSSRATKSWPDEHWIALQARLAASGLRSLLVWGSEEEGCRSQELAAHMADATVAPRLPLTALAAVFKRARLVVGLDTGLSHLAAVVGAPTVGIYCDYDPRLTGIVGDARCASAGDRSGPPPLADVQAAVDRVLAAGEPAR